MLRHLTDWNVQHMMLRILTQENEMQRKSVDVNGITLSYLEAGEGPAILLCHGFPETSQSWRKQIPVLAAAGFRAIAPDLRGYGESSCPEASDVYTMFHIVGDLIGLMDALSIKHAVVVGNDWGASVAWQMALMRPDRIRGVAAFGVPMMARPPMPPTKIFPRTNEAMFYTMYFQVPGLAERELESDVPATLRRIYHAASGEAGPRQPGDDTPNPFGMVVPERGILQDLPEPVSLPAWLSSADFNAWIETGSCKPVLKACKSKCRRCSPSVHAMSDCRSPEWITSSLACPSSLRAYGVALPSMMPDTGCSRSARMPSIHCSYLLCRRWMAAQSNLSRSALQLGC
jgi:pimeloyl-ACP methyl ester carboxylesterase